MILVSVIIPNYNHARYLTKRIDTVLQQTYTDFELIILDDCSTDNSREIIEQYRCNSKIRTIVYNETNSGSTFKQWKKGIQLARGEWIWMAESDDWSAPDFLEVLMKGVRQKRDCVLGFAQSFCMADENTIRWKSSHPIREEYLDGRQFIEQRLVFGCSIFNASMAIFKKEAALKTSNDYTNYRMAGDWLFWINLSLHGKIYINAKQLNYFRKNENNVSSVVYRSGKNFDEELRIMSWMKTNKVVDRKYIFKGIFNKYNNFKKRRHQIPLTERRNILELFYSLCGNKISFSKMIIEMHIDLLLRKGKAKILHLEKAFLNA